MESIVEFSNNRAGVYSDGLMKGLYKTFLIYDGELGECQEWLGLLYKYPRSKADETRFKELSVASSSCPYCKQKEVDELDDLIDDLLP